MPGLGGSLPLYLFTDVLARPAITVAAANHDNNQHAANENLRIASLWYAMDPVRSAADDAVSTTSDIESRLPPLSSEAHGTSDTSEGHRPPARTSTPAWIRLDRDSGIPLYQQIYESIRDAIQDTRLPAGARLPSTRVLAAELSVSRKTVLVAFQQLMDEGLVHGHVGAGTWVSKSADPRRTEE